MKKEDGIFIPGLLDKEEIEDVVKEDLACH